EHLAQLLVECRPRVDPADTRGWDLVVLQALLDVDGPASQADQEEVRREAESVVVEPLDLVQVALLDRLERRASRRRTTRLVVSVIAVLAVVAGAWTWWEARHGPPPGLPDVPVERVVNPVAVGWYADGALQLDRVALTVEDLKSFMQVPQGAVYADSAGEVILVETDGRRTRLGTQAPDGVFAASAQDGLVAWVDPRGTDELHIYDLAEREEVTTQEVGDQTRVVAIDSATVHVSGPEGAYGLESSPGWTALARLGPDRLLDAAGDALVFQDGSVSLLVAHGRSSVEVPGVGAQLAPEGDYVLTRVGDAQGRVRIFDAITGQEIDTGLAPVAEVYAAKLGGRGRATYVVEVEQDDADDGPRAPGSGSLELVTCPLLDPGLSTTCTVHGSFPSSTPWALEQ
ncbi:MAG: hypothetical protein Q8O61_07975, partial [Nocardioides sp.]|nr:hypothetical protein [Nocardioides sp.]